MDIQFKTKVTHALSVIIASVLLQGLSITPLFAQIINNKITVGLSVLPPFSEMLSDNQCGGTYVDAVKQLIYESSPFDVSVVCAPPIRIYRMIEAGNVDLTINVKTTKRLIQHVTFHPMLFSNLSLVLYTHENRPEKSIAAIRGFDYHGFRQKFTEEDYQFVDVPNGMDAVEIFLRERSASLLLYEGTFEWYLSKNNEVLIKNIIKSDLQLVPTYFAVSNRSEHKRAIEQWLNRVDNTVLNRQSVWQFLHSKS
jgi:polar amino acid transport system substrate-binding protein